MFVLGRCFLRASGGSAAGMVDPVVLVLERGCLHRKFQASAKQEMGEMPRGGQVKGRRRRWGTTLGDEPAPDFQRRPSSRTKGAKREDGTLQDTPAARGLSDRRSDSKIVAHRSSAEPPNGTWASGRSGTSVKGFYTTAS
ncbi:hypothetical protein BP6252_07403 [Coleophoma cylindrospora]|uniref:Uncharacterized protein n=1 Tax=Coleophoma cylindrospora TaxID=1849047 RepID=A0A3D8RHR2_9HELO|nr:hypothetical protein BP6252_07403 [Coleophoma cylindrospora]